MEQRVSRMAHASHLELGFLAWHTRMPAWCLAHSPARRGMAGSSTRGSGRARHRTRPERLREGDAETREIVPAKTARQCASWPARPMTRGIPARGARRACRCGVGTSANSCGDFNQLSMQPGFPIHHPPIPHLPAALWSAACQNLKRAGGGFGLYMGRTGRMGQGPHGRLFWFD